MRQFLATSLYYLNDLIFIKFQMSFYIVIVIDYLTRVLSLILLPKPFQFLSEKSSAPLELYKFLRWSLVLVGVGIFIDQVIGTFLYNHFQEFVLFKFPRYPNNYVKVVDLVFGIFLVAVSEEILFRKYVTIWLKEKLSSSVSIVIISSFIFALIHWSSGFHSVINSFFWALLPTYYFLKQGNLAPCVLAHYVTDVFSFLNN